MSKTEKPNIILINCDDLGYGDLACYGSKVNKTPYLDKMAEEGVRFTDYHVMSPVCSASRSALLTGCYPQRLGMPGVLFPGAEKGLHPDEITIGRMLKDQGYRTKIVGKWHVGDQPEFLPTSHGFDEYFGIPYSNDMGMQQGRKNAVPLPLVKNDEVIQEQPDQRGLTERYAEQCVQYIRDNREGPFFLYLAHMYVHVPLFVPQRFMEQSENGGYGGAVECIDWVAGVIFDELKRQGIDEDTMVIFTSDNGSRAQDEGGSNAPCRGRKGQTWEGGQRVPCIVRWPGKVPAGRVCDELITSMDYMPTFAKLAGTTGPQDRKIDGKDITSLIFGEDGAESPHDAFYYYGGERLQAVRRGKWKLHIFRGKKPEDGDLKPLEELYDLEADIGETTNVFGDNPDVVAELMAVADEARKDLGDSLMGVEGEGCRQIGIVEDPKPLCVYDENHPYIVAEYDNADMHTLCG